ncbi:MAG: DUF4197 domain-containing protein [Chitinophagaceae bacterium]|jgi:hypothetical protein|nr:DUF4197 domain-containing protein [Chitinophagaceae bacterium]
MKRIVFFICLLTAFSCSVHAQGLKGLISNVTGKKNSTNSSSSSSNEIASALKEALTIGAQKGADQLSAVDGFFGNAAVKILMPPDAQKVEKTLRSMGLGKQVDDAILSMNRAAEDAAKSAASIFIDAIKSMTIQDAIGILNGGDTAATGYLRTKTSASLTIAFKPTIDASLKKVNATKYWATVTTSYNKIPFTTKVQTDLTVYVTGKALDGIFYEVAQQEKLIRKDPIAQTTDLLKKVFGGLTK